MKNDKKWQINYNKKKHNQKILNAKSSIPKNARSKNSNKKKKRTSNFDLKKQEQVIQILKQYNLQQYKKQLENCGFDECLFDILKLSDREYEKFLDQMNFLPGHTKRFQDMMKNIKQQNCQSIDKENQDTNRQKSIEKTQTTQVSQAFQYLNLMIEEIKCSKKKSENNLTKDPKLNQSAKNRHILDMKKKQNHEKLSNDDEVNKQQPQNYEEQCIFQKEITTLNTESIKESYFEEDFELNDFNLSMKSQNQSTLNTIANIIEYNIQFSTQKNSDKKNIANESFKKRLQEVPIIESKQTQQNAQQNELFIIQEVSEYTSTHSLQKSLHQNVKNFTPEKEEILTCVYQFFANKNINQSLMQKQILDLQQKLQNQNLNFKSWKQELTKIMQQSFQENNDINKIKFELQKTSQTFEL